MGLDFGPDGHLYVCDNQYFYDKDHKSRILRVLMDSDEKPTGEVQVVVDGLKLANAVLWTENRMLVSDTFLDIENGNYGTGGLWSFTKEEVIKAGADTDNPTVKVAPNGTDSHLVFKSPVAKNSRDDNGGLDGLTCVGDVVYTGNWGDGAVYRLTFDADGRAAVEEIHKAGEVFGCCDGMFYDKTTNKIYVNDSQQNAIRAFAPIAAGEKPTFEVIWENGDTDGTAGLLDQPAECVVIGNKLIIANFDWPFPGLKNTTVDTPYSLSVITLD